MHGAKSCILTVNGGSSSIRFALFEEGSQVRVLQGKMERIGLPGTTFVVKGGEATTSFSRRVEAADHHDAVRVLMDWVEKEFSRERLVAVGHRIVHGGPKYFAPQRIDDQMIADLCALEPFDPEHLPEEILLAKAFKERFPDLPQVACFDTAFHKNLPRVAQLLAIPRRYQEKGVRRYGFHGLSYACLMEKLSSVDSAGSHGRIVLAHLGNGASLAAVHDGQPIDTSMGFTPTAGVPMSSRSGDIDPGLIWFLAQTEQMDTKKLHHMVNFESGLLGVSEISSDMRDLLQQEEHDPRAADAVALFCYQVKKWIGAFAAALGGLDTLVFAGGIGENAAPVRARVCEGMAFLGLTLDGARNIASSPVISTASSQVTVRVIPTDEELMIAGGVSQVLGIRRS